jgi:transcriptional regulator with XRE-family HTH domain
MDTLRLQADPKKLKEAREKRGYSARELAERSGLTERMVYFIELGASDPKAWQIAEWARACRIDMRKLFTDAEPNAFLTRKLSTKKKNTS